VQSFMQSSLEASAAGVLYLVVHALCAAAQVQILQGQLRTAEQTCRQAIQYAQGERIPLLGLAWSILGGIALEQNDLAAAELYLMDGISLSRQGSLMDDIIIGSVFLARLQAVQEDAISAIATIHEANSIILAYRVPRMSMLASAYLARIQLLTGQTQAAALWAAGLQSSGSRSFPEFVDLTLVRVLLAMGEPDMLPSILHPLLEKADNEGRMQTSIEAMLLLGLVHHAKKDSQVALDWLGKSLRLAAPEGYARIFLDEGKPLLDLLPKARHYAPVYVDTLLDMIQPEGGSRLALHEYLPEPLSDQELRVLHLIVAGRSNKEIAEELFISVGTAKWHVHNVLQKLGVSSRPQAIARARELGI